MISAERDHIGISLIIYLHFINTKYTLRFIWYDQITLWIQETDMLYKGDTLYLDWLEDGIAELVFDARARSINSTPQPSPASAVRLRCWKSNTI